MKALPLIVFVGLLTIGIASDIGKQQAAFVVSADHIVVMWVVTLLSAAFGWLIGKLE